MGELKVVVFSLNNEYCGIESEQVQEIIKYQEVEKVPKLPKFLEGIIILRGLQIPVVDLNKRFNIGQTSFTKKTKIIISKINEKPVGFIVNDVSEIVDLPEDSIEAPPEILIKEGKEHLTGIGKYGDKLISILLFKKILKPAEIKKLNINKKMVCV